MSDPSDLEDRYGRSRSTRRATRVTLTVMASLLLVALGAWFAWANPIGLGPSVSARDVGYSIEGDGRVTVRFEVTVSAGHAYACAVEALNESFAIVGWKVETFAPTESRTTAKAITVKTTEPAVTGFVSGCWLT